jgi:hypothetical protein
MAGGDYRSCDVCGGKVFYDAELVYVMGEERDLEPYRIAGEEQYPTEEFNNKYGYQLGRTGDWAVICHSCAKTYKTAIVPIGE